jgi:diketogulonate reductase-like aldo/keto reductase
MPPLLYGTAWKAERTADCVVRALRAGFRGIDTACQPKHYNEPGVGEGIALYGGARGELFLQTKFTSLSGQDPQRVPYDSRAPLAEQVAQSLQVSLRNLRTEYLDCWVLHSPLRAAHDTLVVWRAMEQGVEQGLVRQLGISNCYEEDVLLELCASARIQPAVLQNRFYAETGYDKALRALCRERSIVYQSFWTLSANKQLLKHALITGLSKKYRHTPAQILFRYLTQEGVVPLTGTQSNEHMREDLAIFDLELADDERAAISLLL